MQVPTFGPKEENLQTAMLPMTQKFVQNVIMPAYRRAMEFMARLSPAAPKPSVS